MPTEIDWARLAAYIDGEGCITIHRAREMSGRGRGIRRSPYFFVAVNVYNTDYRLPLWCKETFGGNIVVRHHPSNKKAVAWYKSKGEHWGEKPGANWNVGSKKAEVVLRNCLPYFVIKKEQAKIALELRATVKHWGKRPVPAEVLQKRQFLQSEIQRLKKEIPPEGQVPALVQ